MGLRVALRAPERFNAWVGCRPWFLAGLLALTGSCREGEPRVLYLSQFVQSGEHGVFLNEALVFHFTRELDQTSVTRETVRIVDEEGVPARGRLLVRRSQLRFLPEFPLESDLSDGGFRPGTRYSVEVLGFPSPDGLRARSGEPLAATVRTQFWTASVSEDGDEPLFTDDTLDQALPLHLVASRLTPLDPIRLSCAEPLHPGTLNADDFVFGIGIGTEQRIPLSARLVRNDSEGALIELRATTEGAQQVYRGLTPGRYGLWVDPSTMRLRDFGGHVALPAWSHGALPTWSQSIIEVVEADNEGRAEGRLLSFLETELRSPEAVDGADGTARWGADGVVSVLLPESAGSGADGAVSLSEDESRDDIQAHSLTLDRGVRCQLGAQGTVVLRAQGRLEVGGVLTRTLDEEEREERTHWAQWFEECLPTEVTVQTFIDRLRERDARPSWTILVAGGDLVVTGRIEVDGPLLLVAGGRIRVSGKIHTPLDRRVGEGAGLQELRRLRLQPVGDNVLAAPLRYSVLSTALRPQSVENWLPARVGGYSGAGSYEVRFLGEREGPDRRVSVTAPVEDPVLLVGCQAVRLLIDLHVTPGEVWDPPRVDFVELSWE